MKFSKYLLAGVFSLIYCCTSSAQNNDDARTLVRQGIQLGNEKKYPEAIDKFNAALKIDTDYLFADYQLAFSLFAADKGADGIPYLRKVIKGQTSLNGAAHDLLALIYFHNRQNAEAEANAVAAIKFDPKHAGSIRTYALVTFHQNKRAAALLGFCSFLMLEPNTTRSTEAYGNIQHILQGGDLKPEPGEITPLAIEANNYALNQAITLAVAETAKRKYATPGDLLAAQLKDIFTNIGELAAKQTGNDFFRKYMATYFYQLAQSPNISTFARVISKSNPESVKWIKNNPQQMVDMDNWIKGTERGF